MKGLLYKELVSILDAYKKNLILMVVLYGTLAVTLDMPFMLYALIFMMGLYALSSLSFDESSRWDAYARTLPLPAGQLVAAKYLVGLLCMAGGSLLAMALLLGTDLARGQGFENLTFHLTGIAAALMVALLYSAVSLPLSYKMGAAKARSGVMMAMGILFLAVYGAVRFFSGQLAAVKGLLAAVSGRLDDLFLLLLLLGGSLAVYLVSWPISTAIYTSKEY